MFTSLWPSNPPAEPPQENSSQSSPENQSNKIIQNAKDELKYAKRQFESLPVSIVALVSFGLGCAFTVSGSMIYVRHGKRIKNTDWITPNHLEKGRWIRGVVTRHCVELVNQTLHVRIAGVDAPEQPHFGKAGQPHADESLAWLRQKILGKVVYCQLIRRDQYQRVVSNVHLTPRVLPGAIFSGKNLALEMLRSGCAVTYEQAGAEFGKVGKEEYLRVEAEARDARRGLWAKGAPRETPAEYKRRHSDSATPEPTVTGRVKRKGQVQKPTGWFTRLFG
ncbi:hypothetical protein NP233_g8355 [Leucocoprinus birnbaumii]|uniref:TNase-like domain-containing protein n=1 Tax=Leucocoprinus birnbaumii TaxID=56174 RepID=A0AAD5VMH6_9AGAR|nr:hypothetical protein NP233_g8355 [Leucocoprinus birnbaumii]